MPLPLKWHKKACIYGFSEGQIATRHLAFPLPCHSHTAFNAVRGGGAGIGAIGLFARLREGFAAYDANPHGCAGARVRQRHLQCGIQRQDGIAKILAVHAGPVFVQHVAGAIQRQAAVFQRILSRCFISVGQ